MRDAPSVAPALTWYGGDGRIELSGRVAANHLAKICGYLLDEIWLTPGQALHLDLPAHWKQVLWGLGGLLAGATVTCRGDAAPSASGYATEGAGCASGIDARRGSADGDSAGGQAPACVLVTDGPDSRAAQAAQDVLALDLGPLAMAWSGPALPAGVHDAAAEVMGSPDDLADETAHEASNAARWQASASRAGRPPRRRSQRRGTARPGPASSGRPGRGGDDGVTRRCGDRRRRRAGGSGRRRRRRACGAARSRASAGSAGCRWGPRPRPP